VVFKKKDGMDIGLYDEKRRYGEDIQFYQKFFLKDSYYMLAEKLTEVDYDKEYFSQTGLTSNLKKMHLGRNENTRELYDMELISKPYMYLMLIMNQFKYYRRLMIRFCDKYRN
jgi:hypothetical protein